VKSISQETTFARDVRDDKVLETTLKELSAQVGRRLRRSDLTVKTVTGDCPHDYLPYLIEPGPCFCRP
ncbi:MAG: hypothetical protein HGA47_11125, partial [Zoogloea sp.]|nr:hypothetical protein [Zoogloea sp.]